MAWPFVCFQDELHVFAVFCRVEKTPHMHHVGDAERAIQLEKIILRGGGRRNYLGTCPLTGTIDPDGRPILRI